MAYEMRRRVPGCDVKVEVPADHDNDHKSPLMCLVEQAIVGGTFEDLLHELNLYLPDDAREGADDEACIFGGTYEMVCSEISVQIREWLEHVLPPGIDITNLVVPPDALRG